ncbi:MAG: ankyrin repeat domain-containing protein [Planctomycetes bacterium]|nr:ankyrin repeat domain-containing protein [Planctomycetota bacterium]
MKLRNIRFSLRTLVLAALGLGLLFFVILLSWRSWYSGAQLLEAVESGDPTTVRWLLAFGARTDASKPFGQTLDRIARNRANIDVLRVLYPDLNDLLLVYDPNDTDKGWENDLYEQSEHMRALSDADFKAEATAAERLEGVWLTEILRRGKSWVPWLQDRYQDARMARSRFAQEHPGDYWNGDMRNELLILSAVCQLKDEPPPVALEIAAERTITSTFPEMPGIPVRLVNRHPDLVGVAWQEGGNYRHGRSESWSLQVLDDQGRQVCIVIPAFLEGGILRVNTLEYGETMEDEVNLGAYIELLPPGRYTVRAAYAFGANIGTIQEKDRSFMLLSDPVTVEILPPKTPSEP